MDQINGDGDEEDEDSDDEIHITVGGMHRMLRATCLVYTVDLFEP